MDYKPPHPLEVLITPEVLSKYQRMFAFIIRLMRGRSFDVICRNLSFICHTVESALSALFRMIRQTSRPLFPTLAASNKLLLHFRFTAHSFVSALSEYVFDTAIGGNFDPFIARLSPNDPTTQRDRASPEFTDVFMLAKSHSALLDDILSACLLRSGQRAVGELLRHSLELILEFTIVVGDLHRNRMEEYQAAPLLEDISQKFYAKTMTLVSLLFRTGSMSFDLVFPLTQTKVLKGLVDKNVSASRVPLQGSLPGSDMARRPVGGADALHHLLMRLDLGEWWSVAKH